MLAKYLLILIILTPPIQLSTNKDKVGCIKIYLLSDQFKIVTI